jgi:hypothetical protein
VIRTSDTAGCTPRSPLQITKHLDKHFPIVAKFLRTSKESEPVKQRWGGDYIAGSTVPSPLNANVARVPQLTQSGCHN